MAWMLGWIESIGAVLICSFLACIIHIWIDRPPQYASAILDRSIECAQRHWIDGGKEAPPPTIGPKQAPHHSTI